MLKDDNSILKEHTVAWKTYGHGYWPSVVINERTFRGDLTPDNVFEAICAGFQTTPLYCRIFQEQEGIVSAPPAGITGGVLLFVVILLVGVNLLLIVLYRRCSNKELKDDMQLQVNSAVS